MIGSAGGPGIIGEVDLFGVLLPPLLVWLALALLLSALIRAGMAKAGLYRFIWHRPLFDVSLLVILTGLISLAATRLF